MFYFHKVAYIQYLGEVDIFHTWVKKIIPLYNSGKIKKIDHDFPKVIVTNVLPLFYGSQCIYTVSPVVYTATVTSWTRWTVFYLWLFLWMWTIHTSYTFTDNHGSNWPVTHVTHFTSVDPFDPWPMTRWPIVCSGLRWSAAIRQTVNLLWRCQPKISSAQWRH